MNCPLCKSKPGPAKPDHLECPNCGCLYQCAKGELGSAEIFYQYKNNFFVINFIEGETAAIYKLCKSAFLKREFESNECKCDICVNNSEISEVKISGYNLTPAYNKIKYVNFT